MKVSDRGIAELFSHEGIVPMPYKDSVGVWTYGVGHTAAAGKPDPADMRRGIATPVEDVVAVFRRDLPRYEAAVLKAVRVPLKQHEFDALVSFHFNTGAIGRASFVRRLNAGDRVGAAKGMLDWNKPPEIIDRRTAEMKLFRDGVYSNDGKASVYPATASGAVQWGKGRRVDVASLIAPPVKTTIASAGIEVETLPKEPYRTPLDEPCREPASPIAPSAPATPAPAKSVSWWQKLLGKG
jgi:lysozyme